jgi:hypothetical protein
MSLDNRARHRVDISLEYKSLLKEIGVKFGGLSDRETIHLCLQSVYDNSVTSDFDELKNLNPTQEKLDRIISMLEEVLPEV